MDEVVDLPQRSAGDQDSADGHDLHGGAEDRPDAGRGGHGHMGSTTHPEQEDGPGVLRPVTGPRERRGDPVGDTVPEGCPLRTRADARR